jgi:hypothetical protein
MADILVYPIFIDISSIFSAKLKDVQGGMDFASK